MFLQKLASIQTRTSPIKFDHLAENQIKVRYRIFQLSSVPLLGAVGVAAAAVDAGKGVVGTLVISFDLLRGGRPHAPTA